MGTTEAVVVLHTYTVRCLRCSMYAWTVKRRHMLVLEAVSTGEILREVTITKPFFSFGGVLRLTAEE